MLPEQSINFARGNASWIIWVTLPILVLIWDKGKALKINPQRVWKILGIRLLVGFLITGVVVGLLSAWANLGPQYFVILRLQENAVFLKFRRSAPEIQIPLSNIKSVAIVKSGTLSHPTNRLQIETSSQRFQSFGFGRLDDDQVAVLDAFRSRVGEKALPMQQ